jgi:hypothetical protein
MTSGRDRANVGRLRTLLALFDFKFDTLAFGQGLETAALDFAEVREQILAAAVLGDETEAFAFVEPFDGAGLGS